MLKSLFTKVLGAMTVAACAAMMFVSCEPTPSTIAVESVQVDEASLLLYVGESQTLKAYVNPMDATNQSVSWSSSDSGVASVSDAGAVTAVSAGDAVITVTTADGGFTATCDVTVKDVVIPVTGISLNKTSLELVVGDKENLVATVTPSNASISNIVWTTSNEAVVTVKDGAVEAVGAGSAVVTAATPDGAFKDDCIIKVEASEFLITFETNGGSAIDPQVVKKGDKIEKPADPTREGGLEAGLYEGVVDPDAGAFTFVGWFADPECTKPFSFNVAPTEDVTIYAKWESSVKPPIDLSGYTPTDATKAEDMIWVAFDYISSLTLTSRTQFTVVVTESNNYENGGILCCPNAEVLLVGRGEPRTLAHNWAGSMFQCMSGDLILGKNIVISGTYGAYSALLLEQATSDNVPGNIIMRDGSKVCNCTGTGRGIIYNNEGSSTFTMEGGEICDNTLTVDAGKAYAGTMCANWGKFVIKGGKIHNNKVTTADKSICIGGAGSFPIMSRGNAFEKVGGEIYDNVAEFTGVSSDWAGQQLIIGNEGRKTDVGIFKVDNNLGESDNLKMDDRETNPLWVTIWAKGK